MVIRRIELIDFRVYQHAIIELDPGVTAVIGRNAQGKTSLAEAMSYLSTLHSFRGVPNDALVRQGADSAYLRAVIVHDDGREILVEAEINRAGRNKVLVNKQRLGRVRDLLGVVRSTVFAPTDLQLVYEGPGVRRDMLDDALVALSPKLDTLRLEVDRIIKQRNVLLKQSHGRLTPDIEMTLDVWDTQFAQKGTQLGEARAKLIARLAPFVSEAYESLAAEATPIDLVYEPEWRSPGLVAALAAARQDDIRRGMSTVGPHRDDVVLHIKGMPAKSHASQGECRTLALALRLGIHRLVTEVVGTAPLLVLDDVLSELDPVRCESLLRNMPDGQVVITTAHVLPPAAHPDSIIHIANGQVVPTQPIHTEEQS
ncbi:MAG: DNA replication/repair protein RecF [Ilumatobacteraceae bacterium]|nr:DNA replication/repair protein RecF [Ilumatobacteraceae bacterium]